MDGFDLQKGDIIGIDETGVAAKGNLVNDTTIELIDKLVKEDTVSITLFYGKDVNSENAEELQNALTEKYTDCDINLIDGGQPVYYYIISLE